MRCKPSAGTDAPNPPAAALAETGRLVSLDIMVRPPPTLCVEETTLMCLIVRSQEINPSIAAMEGDVQQTVDVGRSLIRCALGETLL